jgi:hypothetical protein
MYVVLHYPTAYSKPVGIWWWDGAREVPTSYYLPGCENYYANSVDVLGSARDEAHWDAFSQKLADRTPWGAAYETDDINVDPQRYLRLLQKTKV